ncbi:CGI-121-domain-containing protein [Aaosphaeria arxii CBS 175.79]|uniref:EKC/KEOPS complex subunit CGI121 n=1 Tax=Aaosphaeria arxii CBS 175.79 TaxID=1450172 RepID=A0A6A5XCK5_9PLEO|nr:CGI-121-domain-containing protein [Aaosphaeria arxii CBS 175.79]KAF2010537.1 CGI-121-domain-containing protein [Aaosphaeria arxii CBS 175.79]
MASVRTFTLPHYPDYPIHIALFKDVSNAEYLRSKLLEADSAFDYAFLDATTVSLFDHDHIISPTQLLSAAFLALHLHLTSRSKSRTPHSELVFRLHPNNNIGESYRKFGIADSTTSLIAVKLGLAPEITNESVAKHLGEHVKGESVPLGEEGQELGQWADEAKLRKIYKLEPAGGGKPKKGAVNGDGAALDPRKEMEAVILGLMTIKGS